MGQRKLPELDINTTIRTKTTTSVTIHIVSTTLLFSISSGSMLFKSRSDYPNRLAPSDKIRPRPALIHYFLLL